MDGLKRSLDSFAFISDDDGMALLIVELIP
jgi:hypothetical protein